MNLQRNASVVIEALKKHQYKPCVVEMANRCFAQLEKFMESEGIAAFNPMMEQQWCAERTAISSRNDFTQALLRLSDVYEHGRVMDMLGFLLLRAWDARREQEKKKPRQHFIDEV